jgi:S1-C subfamily serine protease
LVDQATGTVIGVNTMVMDPNGTGAHGDGLNFAIPAWKIRDRFGPLLGGR